MYIFTTLYKDRYNVKKDKLLWFVHGGVIYKQIRTNNVKQSPHMNYLQKFHSEIIKNHLRMYSLKEEFKNEPQNYSLHIPEISVISL